MAMSERTSPAHSAFETAKEEIAVCPPHHWVIVGRREDGYREEHWECLQCGDAKFVRTPTWANTGGRMNNSSTWTPEDSIIGGGNDEDDLIELEAS